MCIRDRVSTQSTGGTNTTMHWREIVGQVYEYAGASSETEERMFGSIRLNSDGTFELTFRRLSDEGFSLTEQRGTVAVSYTHLRAHETVLDLVCRLLLEKKKKLDK
eukprot:TRINITY_DN7794_c0_g1_i2.p1 TRINITY_DN7794_c0_g1~~TRINITY_DN7794_c0_g1_i2.p1  ORF type:complete len:106 (-),score=23.45 TRINITY_DN7794_c0_g1_i2:10-327(-)